VKAELGGCKAAVVQKDTGVLDSPRVAALTVLAVPQRDGHDMRPRLGGLYRGQNSPWAVIVAAWKTPFCVMVVCEARATGVASSSEKIRRIKRQIKTVHQQDSAMALR